MVMSKYQILTSSVNVDVSYANYLRLCLIVLIPVADQMVTLDWQWLDAQGKEREIYRLMNLAEARDKPQGSEGAW